MESARRWILTITGQAVRDQHYDRRIDRRAPGRSEDEKAPQGLDGGESSESGQKAAAASHG